MKKLLAIAVATALTAPAAMADTTLYGKLHASVGSVKNGATGTTTTAVESHSSRFGIKGSNELDAGLSATYGLEYGLDLDGDNNGGGTGMSGGNMSGSASTGSAPFSSRNQFVGLKGGFGEFRLGKHDTPAKLATAGQDIFADTYADMANIIDVDAHRVNNAAAYINKFGPVGVAVAHITGISAGDVKGAGTANTAMINYSTGPLYAGLGYTNVDGGNAAAAAATSAAQHINLGLGFKNDAAAANVVLEKVEGDTAATIDNALVNGSFKMDKVTLKAQYGESKRKSAAAGQNGKEKLTAIGVDYSLGKKTSVYLLAAEDKNPTRVEGGSTKNTATALGLVTEF